MSNQQPRHIVAPTEYERNQAAISNYRQYLDLYEKLNEQGLRNHEEVERIEMLLQQRIQAGEEAKRQLELLKQTTGRLMLTDGAPVVPDLAAMAPSTPPVTLTTPQTSSSSAYIEEIHQEQMQPSSSSYRPYAATHPMHSSNIPPASYVSQGYPSTSQNVPQHNQQMSHYPPASYPPAHSVTQTPSNFVHQPHIPQHTRYYRPHVPEQLHYPPSTSNSTTAQSEYSHNFPAHSSRSRQAPRPNIVAVSQHQSTTQQNPPHQGTTSHQQDNRGPVPGQVNFQQATTQIVSAAKKPQPSSISRPESSSGLSSTTSTGTANYGRVSSSLDGALGGVTARTTQSPDVPSVPPSRSVVKLDSTGAPSATEATRNNTNSVQLPLPSPSNVAPKSSPSSLSANGPPPSLTSSPRVSNTNQVSPSVRTPKQADKAHLARDLLRALKRPRPDVLSPPVMEPQPKRHASDLAFKPTALSASKNLSSMQTLQPTASTFVATPPTQKSSPSTSVQTAQPIVPRSNAPAVAPPTFTAAPVAASTSTQVVIPILPFQSTTPYASRSPSTSTYHNTFSQPASSSLSFLVPSPNNPGTPSGTQPSSLLQHVGKSVAEPRQSQPNQTNAPMKSIAVIIAEEKQSTTLAAKPSNTSTREVPLAFQPEKNENHEPPPGLHVEGPSAVTSSTVHPSPRKDPLFLPSPTSSPAPMSAISATDSSMDLSSSARKENKGDAARNVTSSKDGPKLLFDYVEVPPLPDWVKKWKAQQNRSNKTDELDTFGNASADGVSISRSPSLGDFSGLQLSSTSSPALKDVNVGDDEESITEVEEDRQFGNYDEAEQQVLHEHCSILRETFCRWNKCEVVLNTPGSLLRHLKMVHRPRRITAESPWTCQWAGCGYTVITREDYTQHIEKHAVFPLWCPFKGCSENFRTPRQCIRHKRSDHDGNAVLRQKATPSNVSRNLTASMPKIPKMFPAYMTEFVRPATIPKHRHETLVISVRRRISGNVPAHLQRYNAARPMPTTPSAKDAEPPSNTPYSFLEHRSTRYSSYLSSPARSKNFEPLHSSYVTNLAKRGLVLWPEEDGNDVLPEAMMEELEQIPMEGDAVEEELLKEEGFDVFGPTISIKTPSVGGSKGGLSERVRE